jgi:hypothetical protein
MNQTNRNNDASGNNGRCAGRIDETNGSEKQGAFNRVQSHYNRSETRKAKNRSGFYGLVLNKAYHAFGMTSLIMVVVQGQDETEITAQKKSANNGECFHPPAETRKKFRLIQLHMVIKYHIFPQKKTTYH